MIFLCLFLRLCDEVSHLLGCGAAVGHIYVYEICPKLKYLKTSQGRVILDLRKDPCFMFILYPFFHQWCSYLDAWIYGIYTLTKG